MGLFLVAGRSIRLPAVEVSRARSDYEDAWLQHAYQTVQLVEDYREGIRAHTNARAFPGREASLAQGKWFALGDVILTASQYVGTRALPGSFTHTAEVVAPKGCVLNIGFSAPLFGHAGGGAQAEYVRGPSLQFVQLTGKHWHHRAGTA